MAMTQKKRAKSEEERLSPSALEPFAADYRRQIESGSKRAALFDQIHACARAFRQVEAHPFFKTRDLAKAFHVSLSAVSAAVANIQKLEGIFDITRGSQIVLRGSKMDESVRLRALVGLPISTGGFLACDPYREFFLNMRSHLRLGACAGVLAFYRNSESCDPDFVQRLQQYGVDKVVWFAPESGAGENIRALQESRIRVVCVGEETFSPVPQHYQIQRSPAACEALRLISDQGLRVVCPGTRDTRRRRLRNDRVADLISEVGDDFTYQGSDTKDLLRYLEELEALSDSALVFKQSSFAEMIALRAPEHLFRLMEKQRVLLAQGPLTFLHNSIPVVKADTIWVDWKLVANRIVHDLLEDRVPSATSPTVFRAQLSVRESLSKRSRFFQTP